MLARNKVVQVYFTLAKNWSVVIEEVLWSVTVLTPLYIGPDNAQIELKQTHTSHQVNTRPVIAKTEGWFLSMREGSVEYKFNFFFLCIRGLS